MGMDGYIYNMKTSIIKTVNDFRDFMVTCERTFALDTETTSLDYLDLEIIGFSICDGKQACYVTLSSTNKDAILAILDYYISEAKIIAFHSAPFDLAVLYKEGIKI